MQQLKDADDGALRRAGIVVKAQRDKLHCQRQNVILTGLLHLVLTTDGTFVPALLSRCNRIKAGEAPPGCCKQWRRCTSVASS
eukprot:359504-Chlamydomonas_euryale.AAC.8